MGLLFACFLCTFCRAAARAAPGDLDPGFDLDGRLTQGGAGDQRVRGLAVGPDGRIVVAGGQRIARFETDGSPDQSFDDDGGQSAPIDIRDVAIQPDGRIVIAGQNALGQFALARYDADGGLDTAFGEGGMQASFFPPPGSLEPWSQYAIAHRLAIQPGGKIVAAGVAHAELGTTKGNGLAIARLNSDGSFDTSFTGDGKTTVDGIPEGLERTGLALQPDGRVVLASTNLYHDFFLVRLRSDGFIDTSFSQDGKAAVNVGTSGLGMSEDAATDVQIQAGKLLVAGATTDRSTGGTDFALSRLDLDGSPDPSFGVAGRVITDFGPADASDALPGDQVNRLAVQPGGKILAAGCARSSSDCLGGAADFGLAAYDPSGSLDPGFGSGGKLTTSFGPGLDVANDLELQPSDGRIVAAGRAFNGIDDDFALARYFAPIPFVAPAGAGKQPVGSTPAVDTTKPSLDSLSFSPKRFRAARSGPSTSGRIGSGLSYKLSEAATVKFRVERAKAGRRSHGGCLKPTRSNRRGKRCTRYVLQRGSFAHGGKAGQNKLRFRGRLRGRKLKAGRYRLRALALDAAGNRSRRKRARFRIVRR